MRKSENAFTLIEVLVVVSILGVLMGLVSVLVMRSGSHQATNDAKQLVEAYLPNMVERYYAEFNKWPPMTIKELNRTKAWRDIAVPDNSTNECIECLVVALRHPDFTARLEDGDIPGKDPFGNTDEDIFTQVPHGSSKADAMEIIDPWGNPVVYIHKNNYAQPVEIINAAGDPVEVSAMKNADGVYYNQNKFQIICLGKDGQPGTGDDIYNFKVEEE